MPPTTIPAAPRIATRRAMPAGQRTCAIQGFIRTKLPSRLTSLADRGRTVEPTAARTVRPTGRWREPGGPEALPSSCHPSFGQGSIPLHGPGGDAGGRVTPGWATPSRRRASTTRGDVRRTRWAAGCSRERRSAGRAPRARAGSTPGSSGSRD